MAHKKVSICRKWYGKIPLDRNGKPIPKNLWPKRRKYSWEVRWYSSEGKRYSKSFKDRKEAFEHAKSIQLQVDKGRADKPKKTTIAEFKQEHARLMAHQVEHTTLKDQLRALKFFTEHIGSETCLVQITPRDAEAYVAYRLSKGLTPATVNKDIRTLRGIFNLAIEPRCYLAEGTNPFQKIRERKTTIQPPNYVPPEDLKKVLGESKNRWWKAFFVLAYTSAGRRDELLNLTWADIDFETHNVAFVPKKASSRQLAWQPKDHEARTIPVPRETVQLLANLQAESDEGNPYVLLTTDRLNHVLRRRTERTWESDFELVNNLTRSIEVICRHAEVEYFTPHDLRRSCITNWARKLPIQTVQHLAGHSSITTTRKYYLAVLETDCNAAREIQSEIMTSLTNY
ncbi:tyrosine-type recombinase/integrase [Planctomycetota bacterium]